MDIEAVSHGKRDGRNMVITEGVTGEKIGALTKMDIDPTIIMKRGISQEDAVGRKGMICDVLCRAKVPEAAMGLPGPESRYHIETDQVLLVGQHVPQRHEAGDLPVLLHYEQEEYGRNYEFVKPLSDEKPEPHWHTGDSWVWSDKRGFPNKFPLPVWDERYV